MNSAEKKLFQDFIWMPEAHWAWIYFQKRISRNTNQISGMKGAKHEQKSFAGLDFLLLCLSRNSKREKRRTTSLVRGKLATSDVLIHQRRLHTRLPSTAIEKNFPNICERFSPKPLYFMWFPSHGYRKTRKVLNSKLFRPNSASRENQRVRDLFGNKILFISNRDLWFFWRMSLKIAFQHLAANKQVSQLELCTESFDVWNLLSELD